VAVARASLSKKGMPALWLIPDTQLAAGLVRCINKGRTSSKFAPKKPMKGFGTNDLESECNYFATFAPYYLPTCMALL
jgi:hypothetical protein